MASIRQRDGKFQVRIIRIGHRALSKTFTNRGDAVKWARAVEVEIERGAIQTHTRSITLSDAIEQYWASPDFPDTTLRLSSPAVRTLLG